MADGRPPPRYDPAWTSSALFGHHGTVSVSHRQHQGGPPSPLAFSTGTETSDHTSVLQSYYSAIDSNPDTPTSPIPLILLQNGGSGYQILGPEQAETRPVSPETIELLAGGRSVCRLTSSPSASSGSTSSSNPLSSPPSYPDSPPSYPESPPSYPHSPPTYNCDNPPTYPIILAQCPSPREVPHNIMSVQVGPSSSNYQITEAEGSHTSLSHEPVGSRNSLSHPLSATSGGSRSSLNHPIVVRTASRNSLTHQPLGSKNSLNQPLNRRASTRHSFHHPPSSRASPLVRTSSSHGPRTSPLHRDLTTPIVNTRATSPSPFYPHNLQEAPPLSSGHDSDPSTSAPTDSGPVTLILQDINPDSTAIYLTHVDHPSTCQLIDPNDLQQIILAEGQRDIDQFEGNPKRRMRLRNVCLVFWSLTCHLGFFVCAGLLIWQVPLKRQSDVQYQVWNNHPVHEQRGPKPQPLHSEATLICASVLLVICYLFSWIESCVSDTHRYIDNKMELTKCRMYVRRMRMTVPKLRWTIDCYHWGCEDTENQHGQRNKGQNEKVVTHTEVEEFPFTVCKDASGDLGTFKKGGINRFEFEKTFGFVDDATAAVYEQRKEAFLQRNTSMDRHYTFKEVFELDGMESHVTVYVERGHLTKLMSFHLYSCLTCCLLTWPYRILFRCFTKKRKFTFVKLLGL